MPNRKRYKKYWYPSVLDMIKNYKKLESGAEMQQRFKQAIDATFKKLENSPDGIDIVKAVHMVYIDDTYGINGAADQLHVSRATVQRWLSRFVYAVGKEMKYE